MKTALVLLILFAQTLCAGLEKYSQLVVADSGSTRARGVRVDRDADFEPALRAALVADRATVIQLALDRAWQSIDQPPA